MQATGRLLESLVVVVAILSPTLHSSADIGIFGGVGQTVFPISSEEIRMVSEKVSIVVGPPRKGGGFDDLPLMNVKAHFSFENESDKPIHVQMGFPDQQGYTPGDHQPRHLVEKLAVRSNGLPVQFEKKKGVARKVGSLANYEQVFVWNSSFAPREKKNLEVSYVVRMSALSEFDLADTDEEYKLSRKESARIHRFYREISPFVEPWLRKMWREDNDLISGDPRPRMVQSGFLWSTAYVMRTGALWKGTIGHASIEVDFNRFLESVQPLRVPVQENVRGGHTVALVQPVGFRWEGAKLIWEMQDFEPAEDIEIGFLTVFYIPRDAGTLRRWLTGRDGSKLSKSTLLMLKDCVLALHGRTSSDPLLKTFFENSMPYMHGKRFPSKAIPKTAQEIVAGIDRALARR